jgi:hypothetical protein
MREVRNIWGTAVIGRADLAVDQIQQAVRNILVRGVGKAALLPGVLVVLIAVT